MSQLIMIICVVEGMWLACLYMRKTEERRRVFFRYQDLVMSSRITPIRADKEAIEGIQQRET